MQVHSREEFNEQIKLYRSIFVGHLCDPIHHAPAYIIPVMLKVCLWKDISMFVETPLLPAACLQHGENSCCAATSILPGCQLSICKQFKKTCLWFSCKILYQSAGKHTAIKVISRADYSQVCCLLKV